MKTFPILMFCLLATAAALHAEVRAFTDTQGRTIRGELLGVTGDFVTIKRESDGQSFTVKAGGFSEADIAYFKEHGLKAAVVPATGATGAAATMRLDVKVTPKKTERNKTGGNYATTQRINFKIELHNTERQREADKLHGTLISVARVLSTTDESQVIGIDSFDASIKPVSNFTHDTEQPAKAYFYGYDQNYGTRYSGYIFILKDSAGKVLNVTSSSETIAKHAEDLLKLKLWDQYDKTYRKTKEGSAPSDS